MSSPHLLPDWWIAANGWDFWADYDAGIWESDTHGYIAEYVTKGSTYVDLGAWVGPTVLWAAPQAARVIAVEPDPIAAELLTLNVAEFDNVEILHGAIATHTGTAELVAHTEGFGASMSRLLAGVNNTGTWDTASPVVVSCWTLPDLFDICEIENVSLVKMDIEGGETDVLPAVCPFLAEREIPLLVSLHSDWWQVGLDLTCFAAFRTINGDLHGTAPILAVP